MSSHRTTRMASGPRLNTSVFLLRPALSEDAAFFTPAGSNTTAASQAQPPSAESNGLPQYSTGKEIVHGGMDDQHALVDYYGQAMDLVSPAKLSLQKDAR